MLTVLFAIWTAAGIGIAIMLVEDRDLYGRREHVAAVVACSLFSLASAMLAAAINIWW